MKFVGDSPRTRREEGPVPQPFLTRRRKPWQVLAPLAVLLITATLASAGTLKGTVTNGTTGKPAAGCDVLLMKVSAHGMEEDARSKTDAAGRFSFRLANGLPRLLRATHQGVADHMMAAPLGEPLELKVYDVVQELKELTGVMHVQRFQVEGDKLQVTEVVTVRNVSDPPRTLKSEHGFEMQLPPEAEIDSGMAHAAGTRPLKVVPASGDRKGQYYFSYPLRPGETRFAVVYRLPYTGAAVMEPKITYAQQRFAVVLPKSLKFEPAVPALFKPQLSKTGDKIQVTAALQPGQPLRFRVSGGPAPAGDPRVLRRAQSSQPPPRSVGGLGAAAGSADQQSNQPWWIAGALAVALTAGVMYTRHRLAAKTAAVSQAHNKTAGSAGLEALKDRLLQLEIGRQAGLISPQQYGHKKAAFHRALLHAAAPAPTAANQGKRRSTGVRQRP